MQTQSMDAARNYQQQIGANVLAAMANAEQDNATQRVTQNLSELYALAARYGESVPSSFCLCAMRTKGLVNKIDPGKPYTPTLTDAGREFLRTGIEPDWLGQLEAEGRAKYPKFYEAQDNANR